MKDAKETRAFVAKSRDNKVLEIFVSKDHRHFSILKTPHKGFTCMVDSGEYFIQILPGQLH